VRLFILSLPGRLRAQSRSNRNSAPSFYFLCHKRIRSFYSFHSVAPKGDSKRNIFTASQSDHFIGKLGRIARLVTADRLSLIAYSSGSRTVVGDGSSGVFRY
jgi:hypothetical protein